MKLRSREEILAVGLGAVLFLGIAAFGYVLVRHIQSGKAPSPVAAEIKLITAEFTCPNKKTISARFDNANKMVFIQLSDGRSMTLQQSRSADGARYTNQDESIVFWNKGNGAFITESDKTTYSGCVTNS